MSKPYKTKPHKCRDCGTTKPADFKHNRKSQCYTCYKKSQCKGTAHVEAYKVMSTDEQKEFGDNATKVMRENLRIRRELLYG